MSLPLGVVLEGFFKDFLVTVKYYQRQDFFFFDEDEARMRKGFHKTSNQLITNKSNVYLKLKTQRKCFVKSQSCLVQL